jgi:hypothetical protein
VYAFIAALLGAFHLICAGSGCYRRNADDDSWRRHPALSEPDGKSHRFDRTLPKIDDPRILTELSRRFRDTGTDDFERRQEYLLRLLDYYYFDDPNRLVGKAPMEVERIFGPGERGVIPDTLEWSGGRDTFVVYFKKGRATGAWYAVGY